MPSEYQRYLMQHGIVPNQPAPQTNNAAPVAVPVSPQQAQMNAVVAQQIAANIARTVAQQRPPIPAPPINYGGGGGGVTANDINGQLGAVKLPPAYATNPQVQANVAAGRPVQVVGQPQAIPVTEAQAQAETQGGGPAPSGPMLTQPGYSSLPPYIAPSGSMPQIPQEIVNTLPGSIDNAPSGPADPLALQVAIHAATHPIDTVNAVAKTVFGTGTEKVVGGAEQIPLVGGVVKKAIDATQKPFQANANRVGDEMYKVATGGDADIVLPIVGDTQLPDPYFDTQQFEQFARHPETFTDSQGKAASQAAIKAVYENGLDLTGPDGKPDGIIDVKGGDAVYAYYNAVVNKDDGFITTMIDQLALDPLFLGGPVAEGALAAGVEGTGSLIEQAQRAGIAKDSPRMRILKAADASMKAAEKGVGMAMDPVGTVAGGIVKGAGKVIDVLGQTGRVGTGGWGWLGKPFEPAASTVRQDAENAARDAANAATRASDIPTYTTTVPGDTFMTPDAANTSMPPTLPERSVTNPPDFTASSTGQIVATDTGMNPEVDPNLKALPEGTYQSFPELATDQPKVPTPKEPSAAVNPIPVGSGEIEPTVIQRTRDGKPLTVVKLGDQEYRVRTVDDGYQVEQKTTSANGKISYTPSGDPFPTAEDAIAEAKAKLGTTRSPVEMLPSEAAPTPAEPKAVSPSPDEVADVPQAPAPATVDPRVPRLRTEGMTPEERNAAIKRGEITPLTPVPDGPRLVDQAYTRAYRDPSQAPAWEQFQADYAPKAQAYLAKAQRIEETYYPDFRAKQTEQVVSGIEHTVDDVAPAYKAAYGDLPEIAPTSKRLEPPTKSGKASYRDENLPYLMQRYVFTESEKDANRILATLKGRTDFANAPYAEQAMQRLEAARSNRIALTNPPDHVVVKQALGIDPAIGVPQSASAADVLKATDDLHREIINRTPEQPAAPVLPDYTTTTLDNLRTDTARFQNRKTAFSERSAGEVDQNFNPSRFEPIEVAENGDGTYTVLSGHSRTEGLSRRIERGAMDPNEPIPIHIQRGTDEELRMIAQTSNVRGTPNTPTEKGALLKRLMDGGLTREEALRQANVGTSAEAGRLLKLTNLTTELQTAVDEGRLSVTQGSLLGDAIDRGTLSPTEAAAFYHNTIVTRGMSDADLRDFLATAERMKPANQVQQFGMFGGMDLGSTNFTSAADKMIELNRKVRTLQSESKALAKSVKSSYIDEVGKQSIKNGIAKLQSDVTALERELGITAGKRSSAAADFLSPETRMLMDLTDRANAVAERVFGPTYAAPHVPGDPIPGTLGEADRFVRPQTEPQIQAARGAMPHEAAAYLDKPVRTYEAKIDPVTGNRSFSKGEWRTISRDQFRKWEKGAGLRDETGTFEKGSLRSRPTTGHGVMEQMIRDNPGMGDRAFADAFTQRMVELTGAEPPPIVKAWTPMARAVRETVHAGGRVYQAVASSAIHSIVTVGHALTNDLFNDRLRMVYEGEVGAAIKSLNPYEMWRVERGKPTELDRTMNALGRDTQSEIKAGHQRSEVGGSGTRERTPTHALVSDVFRREEGSVGDKIIGVATGVVDNATGRDWRQAIDNTGRESVAQSTIDRMIRPAGRSFREWARGYAERNGILSTSVDAYLSDLGDLFSPEDVRTRMHELATDAQLPPDLAVNFADRVADRWNREVNTVTNAALKRSNDVMFSFRRTKLDEFAGKFTLYSYWMSRAVPAYLRIALHNPWVAASWVRAVKDIKLRHDEAGFPDSLHGYIDFLHQSGGVVFGTDPLNIIMPLADMLPDDAKHGWWDKITQFVVVTPALNAAASVVGWTSSANDPLMTASLRKAAMGIVNEVRAATGRNYMGDPYEKLLAKAEMLANRVVLAAGGGAVGADRAQFFDRDSTNVSTINYMVATVIEQDTGIPKEQWGPQQWDRYATAVNDGTFGYANPDYQEGFRQWADANMEGVGFKAVAPGHIITRFSPRDAYLATNYEDLTDAQKTVKNNLNAEPGTSLNLDLKQSEYHAIGTEDQKALASGYADIVYNIADPTKVDPWSVITVDGHAFPAHEVARMSEDDRKALADRWVANNNGTVELADYRDKQDAFVAANPEYGGFDAWKSTAYGYDGGVRAFRDNRAAGNPNFKAELAKRREYDKGKGLSGQALENDLDQWAAGMSGYKAAQGIKDGIYDPEPISTGDQPTVDAIVKSIGSGNAGGQGGTSPTTTADKLKKDLKYFKEDSVAATAILQSYGMDPSLAASNNPYAVATVQRVLGNNAPTVTRLMRVYYAWQAHQPQGADVSPDAFGTYLDALSAQPDAGGSDADTAPYLQAAGVGSYGGGGFPIANDKSGYLTSLGS